MRLSRRDFLRASSAIAAAFGMRVVWRDGQACARERDDGGLPIVWLQGQSCSGCSVSLLNSIFYATIDDLLVNTLDLEFHSTLMPAAGTLAIAAAEKAYRRGGYVLVFEGAVPSEGAFCELWPGLPAEKGLLRYARRASLIMAVGSCASHGGLVAGAPNPTDAAGLAEEYFGTRVIKMPGCPAHPDWVVGTIAGILATGTMPPLDAHGRPVEFYGQLVHDHCPNLQDYKDGIFAKSLGEPGCLFELGCKGPRAFADCPGRRWNSGAAGEPGYNWCIEAGSPCIGCAEPSYPDGMSPFFTFPPAGQAD